MNTRNEPTNPLVNQPLVATTNTKQKLLIFAVVGILAIAFIWYKTGNRTVILKDTEVTKINTTYTPLEKKLVHGEVQGKIISGSTFEGRTIYFCDIVNGRIIEKGGTKYLDCPNSKVKSISVNSDNNFKIRLTSGSYFINSPLNKGEKSNDLPARLNVHSGEAATISINIQ